METKFNFKSQPCSSREQSKRLLALGLKKETADCGHFCERDEYEESKYWETTIMAYSWPSYLDVTNEKIPAWSLHRLIEMTKLKVTLFLYCVKISHPQWERDFVKHANVWDNLCDCIEWLIKEGYFNKEYLV